jgi:NADH-quinone oxidoreductase subunit L
VTVTIHLLLAIALAPAIALGLLVLPATKSALVRGLAVLGAVANLAVVATTYGHSSTLDLPWLSSTIDLSLRVYHTASVVTTAAAVFGLLVTLFSLESMKGHAQEHKHYAFLLITLGLVNGSVFANSLLVLLFFWEGLLGTTYAMIALGGEGAAKTATKALVVSGIGDLCFMMGIAMVFAQTKTFTMTSIHLPIEGTGSVSFVLLMLGALAKCGAMPFHSWIPDAATDAPTPFMAFLPASIEKLLGIYFLSRLTLDLYELSPESWVSPLLMGIGSVTLLLAVLFALAQTDYRRLLAFSAIGQVGFILLGIGSATTVGIVGALFHMLNHATYKSCMFLSAGSIEHQTGSTDLSQLGALRRAMPITFTCFLIAAASGSGVPMFAGFFSKELIFDALLEHGTTYYLIAIIGSFLTTLAFLKLGHAAFFGQSSRSKKEVKEAPLTMVLPMVVTASVCLLFGFYNQLPIDQLVTPMLPESFLTELHAKGHSLSGFPQNPMLVTLTFVVLIGAIGAHWFGVVLNGSPSLSSDHIRQTPGLEWVYDKAALRWFDPYDLLMKAITGFSKVAYRFDRANDWLFLASARLNALTSQGVRSLHRGNTSTYILWSLVAATLVILYLGQ